MRTQHRMLRNRFEMNNCQDHFPVSLQRFSRFDRLFVSTQGLLLSYRDSFLVKVSVQGIFPRMIVIFCHKDGVDGKEGFEFQLQII